jgi:branched-chain amino acid transport system permease protein
VLKRSRLIIGLAVLLAALVGLHVVIGSNEYALTITELMIRLVVVIGLSIFVGNSGIISFGHIGFMCIGAYAAAWVDADPSFKQIMLSGLPTFLRETQMGFVPAMTAAIALPALVAVVLGAAIMRLSGIAASIATFAFLIMVNSIYSNWDAVTAGVSSIIGIPTLVGPWLSLAFALAALAVAQAFQTSRWGLMLRASKDDEAAAKACGVVVVRMRLISFVISAAVVGGGGGLYAHFLGILTIDAFFLDLTFITLAMLVIGGLGDLAGAVVGVLAVTLVVQTLGALEKGVDISGVSIHLPHGAQEIGLGIFMALILILCPKGLLWAIRRAFAGRKTNGSDDVTPEMARATP